MLFNSLIFLFFFTIVYIFYVLLQKKYKLQNILLLVASYLFYGYWDWRFLTLIALSTVIDYFVGLKISKTLDSKKRKQLLSISVISNLSILGFFKYFNFFTDSFTSLFNQIGFSPDALTINIILPVGISFYTFQTMSYTIDIYRNKLNPTSNFLNFALFVSFFPQLVAGPIERAVNLLPQIEKKRKIKFEQIYAALFLILWGYFKKVVIADNAGLIADEIFNNYTQKTGFDLLIGVLAFTVQIYGDFSGYSDIARGIAKLMGFNLIINFKLPYFAVSPSDFWNRWHISLSSWLKDYLYISLGGNRNGNLNTYKNLLLTMILGGLWHGAAWNFVIWGLFHGIILIIYRIFDKPNKSNTNLFMWSIKMLIMFTLTMIGWLIFRAESYQQIIYFLSNISLGFSSNTIYLLSKLSFFILPLLLVQVFQHVKSDLLIVNKLPYAAVVIIYSYFLIWIFIFGVRNSTEFIYFQF